MHRIESEYLDKEIRNGNIRFCQRYVDDVVLVSLKEHVAKIFVDFNNFHPSIEYTIEAMKNNRLPFLDTEIRLCNEKYELFHYQKPTKSDCIGHFTKNIAPKARKISLLTGELNRVNNACTSQEALSSNKIAPAGEAGLCKQKNRAVYSNAGYLSYIIDLKITVLPQINLIVNIVISVVDLIC